MTTNIIRLQRAVRNLSVLAAFGIVADFVSPALWVLLEPSSVMSRVVSLASFPVGVVALWLAGALLVTPFVVMQLWWPICRYRRPLIRTANFGLIMGALAWVFMAFLSRNLDYRFAMWSFIFNGLMALGMAALLANSLNNDQIEMRDSQRGDL